MLLSVLYFAWALGGVPQATEPAPRPMPAPGPHLITNPDWARKPTAMEIDGFYPLKARLLGVEGRVTITCKVAVSGVLEACAVVDETPEGEGFGAAALRLTRVMRMTPQLYDGQPVGGAAIMLPLVFTTIGGAHLPSLNESLRCFGLLSAHARLSPDDAPVTDAAALAGKRAKILMARAKIPVSSREKRLAAALAGAKPVQASDRTDSCFGHFLL